MAVRAVALTVESPATMTAIKAPVILRTILYKKPSAVIEIWIKSAIFN